MYLRDKSMSLERMYLVSVIFFGLFLSASFDYSTIDVEIEDQNEVQITI